MAAERQEDETEIPAPGTVREQAVPLTWEKSRRVYNWGIVGGGVAK